MLLYAFTDSWEKHELSSLKVPKDEQQSFGIGFGWLSHPNWV
tara:strand:+ start:424 stop:549 length:126 start_codon:yes stop_codon:yes gene_type:complete